MAAKTKYNDTSWTPCQLTQEGCLSLAKITHDFSAPITEEHAWAVVFECVKCLSSVMEGKPRVFVVTNTQQILLHREGRVHESTFLNDQCFIFQLREILHLNLSMRSPKTRRDKKLATPLPPEICLRPTSRLSGNT